MGLQQLLCWVIFIKERNTWWRNICYTSLPEGGRPDLETDLYSLNLEVELTLFVRVRTHWSRPDQSNLTETLITNLNASNTIAVTYAIGLLAFKSVISVPVRLGWSGLLWCVCTITGKIDHPFWERPVCELISIRSKYFYTLIKSDCCHIHL
jgi:hypothetical protein